MAKREISESLRARIKFDDGGHIDIETKGSVVYGVLELFECLPRRRRDKIINLLAESHGKLITKEAAREAGTAEER